MESVRLVTLMPEYKEVKACTYSILRWFTPLREQAKDMRVKALWIDATLKDALQSLTGKPNVGTLMKAFYARVDKSTVKGDVVATRAKALLAQ